MNQKIFKIFKHFNPKQIKVRILISLFVIIFFQILKFFLYNILNIESIFFLIIIPIIVVALLLGKWFAVILNIFDYILTTSILYFIWPERFSHIAIRGIIALIVFFVVCFIVGLLGEFYREMKISSKELKIANSKLKKLDNFKNEFIANIAHEFRSPLTIIQGISDLNKSDTKEYPELSEEFNIIHRSTLKLKNSIDRLLNLAKIEAGIIKLDVRKINIKKYLENIVDYYHNAFKRSNIKFQKKIPDKTINIFCDIEKLEEVINNIISNSLKYVSSENGVVITELIDDKDTIIISIKDNGIGIPKANLNDIFNRFEQVNSKDRKKYKGSGIGLSYSKQLINAMKGEIWAESDGDGKGAAFFIKLKKGKKHFDENDINENVVGFDINNKNIEMITDEIQDKNESGILKINLKKLNKKNEYDIYKAKLLIVEDDKLINKVIMDYLIKNNFQNFISAFTGKKGLQAVYDYQPDIIISDYDLKDMTGTEIHNKIIDKPQYKNIPFIYISAVADQNIIEQIKEKSENVLLKKPIDEEEFIYTVKDLLEKYYQAKRELKVLSIDELSGLYNKNAFFDIMENKILSNKINNISIILFEIDDFKKINDKYGNQKGDQVIKEIGKIIKSVLRKDDVYARYEKNKFAILLKDIDLDDTLKVVEKLRLIIEKSKFLSDNENINITSSFGLSSLLDCEEYICKSLKIKIFEEIFNMKNSTIKENYRSQITDILLKMADTELANAKKIK